MKRRRWIFVLLVLIVLPIAALQLRQAVTPDPFASLRPYVIDEKSYVAAPMGSPAINPPYGTRWRTMTLRGLNREELIDLIDKRRVKEGGWSEIQPWTGHFAIFRNGAVLHVEKTPTIQVTVRHGGSGRTGDWERNTDVYVSESTPLSKYDYWIRRLTRFGRKMYDAGER